MSWISRGHRCGRGARRPSIVYEQQFSGTAASATRGAASSRPSASSRSSGGSCCRTRRRCRGRRRTASGCCARRARSSRRSSGSTATPTAPRAPIIDERDRRRAAPWTPRRPDGVRHRLWVITAAPAVDGPAHAPRRQADPDRRRPPPLRDDAGLAPEMRPLDVAAGAAASDYAMMFLARAEDPGLLVLPTHRLVQRPARLRASTDSVRGAGRGLRHHAGRRGDRRGDRGAARRAKATSGVVVRGARVPGEAATIWFTLKSIRRPVGAGAARRCGSST